MQRPEARAAGHQATLACTAVERRGARLVHLHHNKHELTWIRTPPPEPTSYETRLPQAPGPYAPSLLTMSKGGADGPQAGDLLADVDTCSSCHAEVTAQWQSGIHSFASFANPIYREVIPRALTFLTQTTLPQRTAWYVRADGSLDLPKLMGAWQEFWREDGHLAAEGFSYREAGPHLMLMAFLQRIVNGGGHIDREYGVGRGRVDLLVRWPYRTREGSRAVQRRAIEIKVWRAGQKDPLQKGLAQLDAYLAGLGLGKGVLVIFDRRRKGARPPRFQDTTTPSGRAVRLLRV